VGDPGEILAELKRRRVFRALAGWGIASFAVLQTVEPVLHAYHLPEWTLTVVVTLLAAGFPVTVILAWVFDLTTKGITRTEPAEGEGPGTSAPSRPRVVLLLLALGLLSAAPGLVYFFAWPGVAWRRTAPPSPVATVPGPPSIAVLPFANLSSDKEQEYFSDGIAEEILNALAQVDGLRVIGRTSSFSMKGKNEDLRIIGQRLGAANLLEGSVRKAGSRVRITAQLIETSGGSHLWSQEFDRDLVDVFAVQEEIARAVVAALRLKLLPGQAEVRPTIDPKAHDQYLLGVAYLARGSGDAYGKAVEVLRKAVGIDPGYAQAWAALSAALFWHADQSPGGDFRTEWPKALAAAEKAIALAPALSDGYLARGTLRTTSLQDYVAARADLERARSLSPRNPAVLSRYGSLLAATGKLPEAVAVLQEATAIDPLAPDTPVALSMAYLGTGQLEQAEGTARRALEIAPDNGRAARNLGFALLLQGRLPEARAAFARSSNALFHAMGEVMVDHAQGLAEDSRRKLDAILSSAHLDGSWYQVAQMRAWRGEPDQSFAALDRAATFHDAGLIYFKYDPFLKSLRGDPRYGALLTRMKLPLD
jgi:TolB-like protein/Tfp pilus assembly protein PilF